MFGIIFVIGLFLFCFPPGRKMLKTFDKVLLLSVITDLQ